MAGNHPDQEWEKFGRDDPYFGVIAEEEFHRRNLNAEARTKFFGTGEEYVRWIWEKIVSHVEPAFRPRMGLDFGCGVGRLLIPMATRCEKAWGVDVSPSMLAEARTNCSERGIENISLVKGFDGVDPALRFDFVNSFIVFQHMLPEIGMRVFRQLLERLNPGGVGALHFIYRAEISRRSAWVGALRRRSQWMNAAANLIKGMPWNAPWMQMNTYDLNTLALELHRIGCTGFHSVYTEHAGFHGVILLFRKPTSP